MWGNGQYQDEDSIYIQDDQFSELLHELLHYVVATPLERQSPNLMLWDAGQPAFYDPHLDAVREGRLKDAKRSEKREQQVGFLRCWLADQLDAHDFWQAYNRNWSIEDYEDLSDHQINTRVGMYRSRAPMESFNKLLQVMACTGNGDG